MADAQASDATAAGDSLADTILWTDSGDGDQAATADDGAATTDLPGDLGPADATADQGPAPDAAADADAGSAPDAAALDTAPDAAPTDTASPIALDGNSPAQFGGSLNTWNVLPTSAIVAVGKPPFKPGQPPNPYPNYSAGLIDDLTGDGVADLLLFAQSGDARVVTGPVGPSASVAKLQGQPDQDPRVHSAALWMRPDGTRYALLAGSQLHAWRWTGSTWVDEGETFGVPEAGSNARHCVSTVDLDSDGLLDLLECRYQCDPGAAHRAWIDRGDGLLVDKTATFGLVGSGAAWNAGAFDLHDDGQLDIVWMHDGCANPNNTQALYENKGRDGAGQVLFERVQPNPLFDFPKAPMPYTSPMGCDNADFDGDGHLDLAIANVGLIYPLETAMKYLMTEDPDIPRLAQNNLLLQKADGSFSDAGLKAGLKSLVDPQKGLDITVWGIGAWDFDRDGWVDLAYAAAPDADSYENQLRGPMRPLLLRNQGNASFVSVSDSLNLPQPELANTLALGDLDGDGDQDWVLGQLAAPPIVLQNQITTPFHELRVQLRGRLSNPLGVGARITVTAGQVARTRLHGTTGTFATHHQLLSAFGLGTATAAQVQVRWPSGRVQDLGTVAADQTLNVEEPDTLQLSARTGKIGTTFEVELGLGAQPQVELVPPGVLAWASPLQCDSALKCKGKLVAQNVGTGYLKLAVAGQTLAVWPKLTVLP
ncbi:MAG: CRTAC1 family protein [Deltaproteobacteria bacterium]|nr:CRTAC1 family protein [Deltaproteobacteria bacterium]